MKKKYTEKEIEVLKLKMMKHEQLSYEESLVAGAALMRVGFYYYKKKYGHLHNHLRTDLALN